MLLHCLPGLARKLNCAKATIQGTKNFHRLMKKRVGRGRSLAARFVPNRLDNLDNKVSVQYGRNPARSIPRRASGLFMNVFQTNPVLAFSAISMVIPVSIPIKLLSYQFLRGLNEFTKPYLPHAAEYRFRTVRRTRIVG